MEGLLEFFKTDAAKLIATLLYLVVEFWLGKTDKVKAGSVLEIVLNAVKGFLSKFTKAAPEKKDGV
jgi:hypothetical protein